jgi:hypothetical protein
MKRKILALLVAALNAVSGPARAVIIVVFLHYDSSITPREAP